MEPFDIVQGKLRHFASLGFTASGSHYRLEEGPRYALTLKHSYDPASRYGEVICDAHLEKGKLMLTFSTPERIAVVSQEEFSEWLDTLKELLLLSYNDRPDQE